MRKVLKIALPLVLVAMLIAVFCTVAFAADGDVVTEYGTIPADKAADTNTNRYVMFVNGEYVTSCTHWLGSSASSSATGAMAQRIRYYCGEGQVGNGQDVVILMRSDETHTGTSVPVLDAAFGSLTVDFGGNNITVKSAHFINQDIAATTSGDINVTFKNGTVLGSNPASSSKYFLNILAGKNTSDVNLNITYQNMVLEGTRHFFSKNSTFAAGKVNVKLNVIDTTVRPIDTNRNVIETFRFNYFAEDGSNGTYNLLFHNVTYDNSKIAGNYENSICKLYVLPENAVVADHVIEGTHSATPAVYDNATVQVCECGKILDVEFATGYNPRVNATLENNFGLNLYVPSVFGVSDIKINGKPYAEEVGTATLKDGTECHVITVSDIYADIAGTSYKISYALDPDGDGEAAAIRVANTVSIPKYSTLMLNQYANDTEAKQMMADALNYAKAAADYTGNTSGAEYANVEAAIATYANAGVNATAPTVTGTKETTAAEGVEGVTFVLGQTTAMRIYINSEYTGSITITGTGINGTYTSADYKTDDVGTYVDVEAKAYHIANDVTIATDTGSTEFNLATYIELISTQGDDNATAAAKALYAYALSAAAYQNK